MATRLATYDDITGLLIWLDPNTGVTLDGTTGNVTKWTCRKSGLAFTPAGGGNNQIFTFSASYQNGKPAVVSDGNTEKYLAAPALPDNMKIANISVLTSAYFNGFEDGQWRRVMGFGQNADQNSASIQVLRIGNGNKVGERTLSGAVLSWAKLNRCTVVTKAGTAGSLYVDGALSITGTFASAISGTLYRIFGGLGFVDQWIGGIQGHAVWDHALSTTERQMAEGIDSWSTGKNGANLPADHPYKAAAPTIDDGTGGGSGSATDALVATESATARANAVVSVSDVLTATDTVTAALAGAAAATDTITAVSIGTARANAILSITDTLTATDTATATVAAVASLSDVLTPQENAAVRADATAAVTDAAVLTEAVAYQANATAALSDALVAQEGGAPLSAAVQVSQADNPTLTDQVTGAGNASANAGQSDALSLTDTPQITARASLTAADAVTASDTATAVAAATASILDVLAPVEGMAVTVNVIAATADAIVLVEGGPTRADARPTAADALAAIDTFSIRASVSARLDDVFAYSENNSYTFVAPIGNLLADTGAILDLATVRVGVPLSISDIASLVDQQTIRAGVSLALFDTMSITDNYIFTTSAWFDIGGAGTYPAWSDVTVSGDGWVSLPDLPPRG